MTFDLKELFSTKEKEIFEWLDSEIEQNKKNLPIYSSIDVRISKKKIAHVDSNIFPAGFHVLDEQSILKASDEMQKFILNVDKSIEKIVLVPEAYSRNSEYSKNLTTLTDMLENKNFKVDVAYIDSSKIESFEKNVLQRSKENRVVCKNGFSPDFILLNNDLISESPKVIQNLDVPISPNIMLGWHSRTKHQHIKKYHNIVSKFSDHFGIDPWTIEAYSERCSKVDISKGIGIKALIEKSEKLLAKIRKKYKEYGITTEPSIFIKAESSTHGLGIISLKNPEDLENLNKKDRQRMKFTKYKTKIENVIIQEAIPTIQQINNHTAESTCYIVNGSMIGGFRRFHKKKNERENLNSTGAEFASGLEGDKEQMQILKAICKLTAIANSKELDL